MRLEELAIHHKAGFLKLVSEDEPSSLLPQVASWNEFEFAKFLRLAEKQRLDWRPGPGKISQTYYVMFDEKEEISALGFMRFPLEADTENDGGNLICEVPPTKRGRGHGSVCLSLLLFEAVRAGLRRVFVTCPESDLAARRVIEKNRGVLLDVTPSTRADRKGLAIARYWISFR